MTRRSLTFSFVLVALAAIVTSACVSMYDPVTATNIGALTSKDAATQNCAADLAREAAKTGSAKDPHTLRHIQEICDCYAAATTPHMIETCQAKIPMAVQHEEAKHK